MVSYIGRKQKNTSDSIISPGKFGAYIYKRSMKKSRGLPWALMQYFLLQTDILMVYTDKFNVNIIIYLSIVFWLYEAGAQVAAA